MLPTETFLPTWRLALPDRRGSFASRSRAADGSDARICGRADPRAGDGLGRRPLALSARLRVARKDRAQVDAFTNQPSGGGGRARAMAVGLKVRPERLYREAVSRNVLQVQHFAPPPRCSDMQLTDATPYSSQYSRASTLCRCVARFRLRLTAQSRCHSRPRNGRRRPGRGWAPRRAAFARQPSRR
jgi:hypothetical protein